MRITPKIQAYARGYADGQAGADSPPYTVGSDMHEIYEQGRLDSQIDSTPPCRSVAAVPIRAKTGK